MLPLLRTVVEIPEFKKKITYSSSLLFIGSCFSEEIGNKLEQYLFNIDLNPFGIIYNPASIAQSLQILIDKLSFSKNDIFKRGQLWLSFYHHSRFSSTSQEELLKMINQRIEKAHYQLINADFLFITFGTAWVYKLKETGQVVANSHKLPQKNFIRVMLSVDEIIQGLTKIFDKLLYLNSKLNIILTVSPVRHWKDGAIGNQYSKASLLVAIHKLIDKYENVKYFPSYEIVMDELRDYRFYSDDMLHIGTQGVEYIWLRFKQTFFDETTENTIKEVDKVIKALHHRPHNKDTQEYRKFLDSTMEKIMLLRKYHPNIKIEHIQEYFTNQQKKYNSEN